MRAAAPIARRPRRAGRLARTASRTSIVSVLWAVAACTTSPSPTYRSLESDLARATRPIPVREEAPAWVGDAVLSRDAYLRALLARNPGLREAREAFRAALARHPQVTALDDPSVGIGAAPLSFGNDDVDDAWVLDVSQRIPFPGKRALRGEAALAEAEARRGDLRALRLRLAALGSTLFDDYYLAARALEINAAHLELVERFRRIALARYEAGRATQQDPLQAETELARLLQRELELETQQRLVRQRMNALLHRPPGASLPPAPEALEPPRLPGALLAPEPAADELAPAALAARPELEAAQARVRAREADVGWARRAYLPDLTLVGNYNRRLPIEDNRPFVGVRFEVPLQLGRLRAAVDEARARLAVAESRHARLLDSLELELHESLAQYRRASAVSALFDGRLLPAARDRVAAAQSGFETGRNSFLELIDAERELRSIELEREAARADVSRRAAQLLRALGQLPGLEGEAPSEAGGTS